MMGVTDDDLATALHLMMAVADHTEPQVPGAPLNHKPGCLPVMHPPPARDPFSL